MLQPFMCKGFYNIESTTGESVKTTWAGEAFVRRLDRRSSTNLRQL
jgi:hypothetical protein